MGWDVLVFIESPLSKTVPGLEFLLHKYSSNKRISINDHLYNTLTVIGLKEIYQNLTLVLSWWWVIVFFSLIFLYFTFSTMYYFWKRFLKMLLNWKPTNLKKSRSFSLIDHMLKLINELQKKYGLLIKSCGV